MDMGSAMVKQMTHEAMIGFPFVDMGWFER